MNKEEHIKVEDMKPNELLTHINRLNQMLNHYYDKDITIVKSIELQIDRAKEIYDQKLKDESERYEERRLERKKARGEVVEEKRPHETFSSNSNPSYGDDPTIPPL